MNIQMPNMKNATLFAKKETSPLQCTTQPARNNITIECSARHCATNG